MFALAETGAIYLSGLVCVSAETQQTGQTSWLQFIRKIDCDTVN